MKRNTPYWASLKKFAVPVSSALMLLPLGQVFAQDTDPELDDDVILLSPFEVDSSSDVGYLATSTLAGTRLRTNLSDTGSALQVVTEEYMSDIGATSSQDLLQYTTSTEVGGVGGNFTGLGDGSQLDSNSALTTPQSNTRVRGLTAADNARNFFLTDIPWDSYNTKRIDIQRGPNAILFGLGSPAGLINGNVDGADISTDFGEVEFKVGSYGTARASFNVNKVIVEDELAVRVAGLSEKEYYRQDPTFEKDDRLFVAAEWQPQVVKDLLKGVDGKLTIKANFETGEIEANRPRPTPPIDAITPWYTELNQATYNPWTINLDGTLTSGDANYNPWIASWGGRIYDNPVAVFSDPTSGEVSFYTKGSFNGSGVGADDPDGSNYAYAVLRGIASYSQYASSAQLPGYLVGAHKDKTLTDSSIFDFYNKSLEGENKREWQDFDAYNLTVSQTFFDDTLGVEAVYDKQKYTEGSWNMMGGAWSNGISVDMMEYLIQPAVDESGNIILDDDGNPTYAENPNVGRPVIASDSTTNQENNRERETFRVTAFYDLDLKNFMDPDSLITKIINRNVFTGVYAKQKTTDSSVGWIGYTPADGAYYGSRDGAHFIYESKRILTTLNYLGDSLIGTSLGDDLNIGNLQVQQDPTTGNIWEFDNTLLDGAIADNNLSNYAGWENHEMEIWNAKLGDRDSLYNRSYLAQEEITSKIFVWQGYLFEGNVVPIIGYREDSVSARSLDTSYSSSYTRSNGSIDIYSSDYKYGEWVDGGTEESLSYSITVHAPDFITKHLPLGMELSAFYNYSENFEPGGNDIDVLGTTVPGANGETLERGFTVSILENRLVLKVNKYKTKVKNSRLDGSIGGSYLISAADAWGYLYATAAREGSGNFYGYYDYNATSGEVEFFNEDWTGTGNALRYNPTVIGFDTTGMTDEAEIRAVLANALQYQEDAISAMLDNPSNLPPAGIINTWGIDYDGFNAGTVGWIQGQQPSNVVITGDTESQGYEFELTARPTDNWNISLNVSKTDAVRINLAESFGVYVEGRNEFFNSSPYGNVMLWDRSNVESVQYKWNKEFWGNYRLFSALTGSSNPEIRKWRWNLVTNYKFTEGALKGVNVGLGYRWEDKVAIGYPVTESGEEYDITNPYYGPTEDHIDVWVGYERDLTEKIHWRIQLNVKNLFASDDLIPISCQPDGTAGAYRIPDETKWYVTNTFTF